MENGGPALKQRKSIHFGDFWHISDDFELFNAINISFKAEKHHTTNLYMLYPMVPSVVLIFVEKVKKITP
jgi:hypothetical protein